MTASHDNRTRPDARGKIASAALVALAVAVVALLSRLPALGAWWNQDDWGLLARAAGLIDAPDVPLRFLARDLYWRVMWPLAGLDPDPYAMTRLLLHAAAAAGVVQLAARLGMSTLQRWLAGLIMAATPLAFTPLYWAAGVQDLLAVAASVWALERWLALGRGARSAAVVLAVVALAAKETVVGLPVLMALLAGFGPTRSRDGGDLAAVGVVAAAALGAVMLALGAFDTGADQPYALGGAATVLRNLTLYGVWLALPGPVYPTTVTGALVAAGAVFWLAWIAWAAIAWRRGHGVPLLGLVGGLLMLAPLLPLGRHVAPDLAYPVEPFGCLALAALAPARWRARPVLVTALVALAVAWGWLGMRGRLELRDATGRPADPVVRRTAVSWAACNRLRQLPVPPDGLVIVQPPLAVETAHMAGELGEDMVLGSSLYHALDGAVGPRLILGDDRPVLWTNGLRRTPERAFVVLDRGDELVPWGLTGQALLNQALTDVGLGFFERARLHLLRATLLSGQTLTVITDPGLLPVSEERILANKDGFVDHLVAGRALGRTDYEINALHENFYQLLAAFTGRDVESLRARNAPGAP